MAAADAFDKNEKGESEMKKRIFALALAMVLLVGITAGCSGSTSSAATPTAGGGSPSPSDSSKIDLGTDEIKIGFVGALTGASATMGEAIVQGAQLAVDEINAAGGIAGVPLKLVTRDDEADPTKNLTGVEELIYKEDIKLLLASPNSACASASIQTVNDNEVPELINTATSAALTDPEKYPFTFRNTSTNYLQAGSLTQAALDGKYTNVVTIGDTSSLGVDGFAATKEWSQKVGLKVNDYISYVANDSDLTAVAQKIVDDKADAVIAWTLGADAAKIIKALDRLDYLDKVIILGYTGMTIASFQELVGDVDASKLTYLNFTWWTLKADADQLGEAEQAFYEKVNAAYGTYKTDGSGRTTEISAVARAYDSVYFLKWLVEEKTHSIDGTDIKNAIETYCGEYTPMCTESGPYTFSATDHEGFDLKDLTPCSMKTKLINDKVFGDVPWQASF
jgi:branched-chain amino acid transport system substrate-binding protein